MKKSLFFAATLVAVAVFGASACSYSDEAENRVRNMSLNVTGTIVADLSDDVEITDECAPSELSWDSVPWVCLNKDEQKRAQGLLISVESLVDQNDWNAGVYDDWRTLLELLLDFEALEILCYTGVLDSMVEEDRWPASTMVINKPGLLEKLLEVKGLVVGLMSRTDGKSSGVGTIAVLEPLRFRHLCPSWIPVNP